MSLIGSMAEFVSGTDSATLSPDTLAHAKMHILDTVGAMLAGPRTPEGVAIGKFIESLDDQATHPVIGYVLTASLPHAVFGATAATRSTEIDDIHLGSCTTPGSVVVTTALCLACAGHFEKSADILSAIVVGYELLIRMGLAIDGPQVLYQGVWPTYMGTPLASAALTCKGLRLDSHTTAHALAIALSMSTGVAGRIRSPLSSRWLTLGAAAEHGVIAAFAARQGFAGDEGLLDKDVGPLQAIIKARDKLVGTLGGEFLITETALKPYPSARQALAAIEAFKEILTGEGIDPSSIDEIIVHVPAQYAAMIDSAGPPRTRQESLLGVQYQMALAAFHPEILFDVNRELLPDESAVVGFMKKVHVRASEELEKHFPALWPAMVEVRSGERTFSRELLRPAWDSCDALGWEEIEAKFKRVAGPIVGRVKTERIIESVHCMDSAESVKPLVELLFERQSLTG
jgi:2-methylcitrate dehydratase PrpD